MRDTYIIGAGQLKYDVFPDRSYRSLFTTTFEEALGGVDGIEAIDIDEAVVGSLGVGSRQLSLSEPAMTGHVGPHGVPCSRIGSAYATSGYAARRATQTIKSEVTDVVLAGGYGVMTDTNGNVAGYRFGVSGETGWERLTGTTFTGVYAQIASAYLDTYDASSDHFSKVAVRNHANDAKNPKAHLGFKCSFGDVRGTLIVAGPLNFYHCCPASDDAIVILIANEGVANAYDDMVHAVGMSAASGRVGSSQRDSYTIVESSERATAVTYEIVDLGPGGMDSAEVRDCFATVELLACENLGFYKRRRTLELVDSGATELGGDLPVNPSGDLKSRGHLTGATDAGQVVGTFK